jgi:hypothetical protein
MAKYIALAANSAHGICSIAKPLFSSLCQFSQLPRGGGPSFDTQFDEDVFQVFLNRPRADAEDDRDFSIGLASTHPKQDFGFAPRQP